MFIGSSPLMSRGLSPMESIQPALPLAGTVVEVPSEVQMTRLWPSRGGQEEPARLPKEKSRLSAGLPCTTSFGQELATALALLIGVLGLTVRILLLLSGFLAATLLLAGLLARLLILLARILVLIGHWDLPC
jgi:hypothetical protein